MKVEIKENLNKRIDTYLNEITDYSRSKIEKAILDSHILVNDQPVKKSYLLKENDIIEISELKEIPMDLTPEDLNLDIIYEDDDLLVVNKQNGMVVHPAPGNHSKTLVNGLLFHSKTLSGINGEFRPGIVHRIDAYTTGLLMVAKNDKTHLALAKQLEEKTTTRKYIALVWGVVNSDTGTVDAPIGRDGKDRKKMAVTNMNSKEAITNFKVLKRFATTTLLELELKTGRTHQIRVHMDYIDYPIVNDPVYGRRKKIDDTGQCLHAYHLGFKHPKTNEYIHFEVDLPTCFTNILKEFE